MKREDWLLVLVDDDIDPIRIQKGMFLFAMESSAPPDEKYDFRPYNWGPCSFDIYDDLDTLVETGLVSRQPVPGARWHKYGQTPAGQKRSEALLRDADPMVAAQMQKIAGSVTSKSFDKLLEAVYSEYPDYATRSMFKQRRALTS